MAGEGPSRWVWPVRVLLLADEAAQAAWLTVIVLRLTGTVHWSWWWVLAPAWLGVLLDALPRPLRFGYSRQAEAVRCARWKEKDKWYKRRPNGGTFPVTAESMYGLTWCVVVVLDLAGRVHAPLWLLLMPLITKAVKVVLWLPLMALGIRIPAADEAAPESKAALPGDRSG